MNKTDIAIADDLREKIKEAPTGDHAVTAIQNYCRFVESVKLREDLENPRPSSAQLAQGYLGNQPVLYEREETGTEAVSVKSALGKSINRPGNFVSGNQRGVNDSLNELTKQLCELEDRLGDLDSRSQSFRNVPPPSIGPADEAELDRPYPQSEVDARILSALAHVERLTNYAGFLTSQFRP